MFSYIESIFSYRAVNTICHGYKNQSVNAVYGNHRSFVARSIQNTNSFFGKSV